MEVDNTLRFVIVESGKNGQNGESGKNGQNSGVLIKDLPKDLQVVYNSLNQDAAIYFNYLKNDKEKTDFLKVIQSESLTTLATAFNC